MQEFFGDSNDPDWATLSLPSSNDLAIDDRTLAPKSAPAMPRNDISFEITQCGRHLQPILTAQKATVLIVDSVSPMRHYLADLVRRALPFAVQIVHADSDQPVAEHFDASGMSMVIMDPLMPSIEGSAAASRIWSRNPKARILFWMQSACRSQIVQIVKVKPPAAIHGFILQSGPDEKLTFAIQSVFLHNNQYLDPELNLSDGAQSLPLTGRERETVVDIVLGLTDRAIALKNNMSVRGVQNRIQRIFQKMLGKEELLSRDLFGSTMLNHRARLIYEAFRQGLVDQNELRSANLKFLDWTDRTAKSSASDLAKLDCGG